MYGERSYVVLVTASGFNLVAMVCSESYVYNRSTRQFNADSRPTAAPSSLSIATSAATATGSSGGRIGCTLFGVLMVDACSLLVHLGPTIIGGGDFYHRATVTNGPCIPIQRAIKVYGLVCYFYDNNKLSCCCDSRSYCVLRTLCYSFRPLSGTALVSVGVYLFTVTNRSLLLVSVSFFAAWLNDTSYSKTVSKSE